MKFLIISSKEDMAGVSIHNLLKKEYPELEAVLIDKETIFADSLDRDYPIFDFFIFATRHQSQQHRKTFSLHAPGNWLKADYGGQAGKVCNTSAFFLKYLFQVLDQEAKNKSDFEVTLEVTHHGPFIKKPCVFIEIGTTIEEWEDKEAARIICKTIKKAISNFEKEVVSKNWVSSIAIGGLHYCPAFNKIQISSEYAISHIIPQYVFPITEEVIKEAISKTNEPIKTVIIDWKGLKSEEKKVTMEICEKIGLKVVKSSDINK